MRFRAVCRALSVKVVLPHHALKAFSFGTSNHVDIVARLKLRNAQINLTFWKSWSGEIRGRICGSTPAFLNSPKSGLVTRDSFWPPNPA